MKPAFYTLIVSLFVTTLMISCKSAGKLYQQGNYDEAVEVAVKKLQKKPSDAEMKTLIQNAYSYAVKDHENRIMDYSANSSDLKFEWIYNEYIDLQNLYNAIYRAPAVFELVKPVDYSSYTTSYRKMAGDARVERGLTWMKQPDRESAKKAYREFQTASVFLPNDIKVQQLLTSSYDAAVTRVVISVADSYGFQYSSYQHDLQNADNEMIAGLINNTGNEFVRFYSIPDARSRAIEPDQVVELHLNDITLGHLQESHFTKEVTKDVVIKEIVYKADSVVKIYGKVKARITTIRRTLPSGGSLGITIRDSDGRMVWNDNVFADKQWTAESTTYTGDIRALGEEDKHLINRGPGNIPGDMSIMDCIKQELSNQASYRIKEYYSRY